LFILKENGHAQFFKEKLLAKDSYEKEYSIFHSKYFSKSSESKNVSKYLAADSLKHLWKVIGGNFRCLSIVW